MTHLKKSELIDILNNATTSRDKNRAVKALKKFTPVEKKDFDDECQPHLFKQKKTDVLQAFVCFRCDKVRQTYMKVIWTTSKGVKTICHTCFKNLESNYELDGLRKQTRIAVG
ncbi:unnamed protein product [Vitrella brassicaformis CCMP3155]|uniref:Uncharacterized protein n=2 Tax=Vitrella brassicaformis TaxID=1169539 RepID=A0A0G4G4A0_VITBC|nr:unnamed protein product [Vitrella brassicaformis CCMP3155]|eukprot:CEM23240.1 unnamed protein product [Vitrella brassicaformis CCMP3155]